ncbi:hypothetical protein QBA57_39825 [Streptomyces scabiei]|uniref:hypothetical protein n=1 Tax=Streptomyces scabiei TaxID=1930 RepID=UPI002FF3CC5F
MSEIRESPAARTYRELDAFEAVVFQFGQRARAFLNAFPTDLPEPISVIPRFPSGYGPTDYAANSYLHLTVAGPDDVAAWAERLGAPVTRSLDHADGLAFVRADGVLGGARLFVGCMTTPNEEEKREASLRAAAEGDTP